MTGASSLAQDRSPGGIGLLDRERIIAKPGFNRWLVPPAALCIHLCIGMAYGFSRVLAAAVAARIGADGTSIRPAPPDMTFLTSADAVRAARRLRLDDQFDLGWMYTLFFVFLGSRPRLWGGWLERAGPRKAGVVAALCWCGGLLISAIGVYTHQLWLMWLGSGVIGGIGLGLGYISPVSTLIKWFPDRRGMATGMAIMGFGGGAMIGSPLADLLMKLFATPTSVGVWQTFLAMAAIYFVFMMVGAFGYRLPPHRLEPAGLDAAAARRNAMITTRHVHLKNAHKTPQFWLIWAVLCLNVSAGIGIIGMASPMLQEIFGGALIGVRRSFRPVRPMQQEARRGGRPRVSSACSRCSTSAAASSGHRSRTSSAARRPISSFFMLGVALYALAPGRGGREDAGALRRLRSASSPSMYGGGFATVPAYLADMFGTPLVGAIHGRLLTAWSTAGILGPVVVNYLHDKRLAEHVPVDQIYGPIFYVLAAMLAIGWIANLLVRPVDARWHMSEAEVAAAQTGHKPVVPTAQTASGGIGKGGLDARAACFWLLVGVPLAWGIWNTVQKALVLFR